MPRTRVRLLAAVVGTALAIVSGGCASAGDAITTTPSPPRSVPPSPTPTIDPLTAWVDARLESMTLEQKAASLIMGHVPGVDPAPMRAFVEQGTAGLILMGDNMPATPAELASLTAAVQVDPEARALIAIDEEGGIVTRLPWDALPGAEDLRAAPPQATQDAFAQRAALLEASGVDVNFGIVADVTDDPGSFIFERVLGTDPRSAADRVAAAVTGEHGTVASTLKHFPGHGAAPGDSHSSVPTAPLAFDDWRSGPALPFQAGVDAGAELVMTGHLVYPAIDAAPASLSPRWHEILREDLGFEGVVVTDDLLMLQHNGLPEYADPNENAVRAVAAGADLLLYALPADPAEFGISVPGLAAAIADAVRSGRLPQARLDEAAAQVLALRRTAVASDPANPE
ncbi:glycoside hydrolase family 3 N-terminal domain-containing protein [Agromyces larvae]|uniref:Glycoside hydrolase family 3 protein n=1 Tax=Agromyces larvae TaxID=2929802 RepID=A0ABY4C0V8_9MICO|nr:glycoside hydrolase family 3 N-terminal domain-containing protein [Agromyces larvae]UOE45128.1 glycoside hydrolase family 3 protein [Agromyces larvae]